MNNKIIFTNNVYDYFTKLNSDISKEIISQIQNNLSNEIEFSNLKKIDDDLYLYKINNNYRGVLEYDKNNNLIVFVDIYNKNHQKMGTNFIEANLKSANLENSIFSDSDFSNANLTYANLTKAILENAQFVKAILTYAILTKTYLKNSNFSNAILNNVRMDYSNSTSAVFKNAILNFAKLNNSDFWNADFSNANLESADLSKSNLTHADFNNTNLKNADLSGADLSEVIDFKKVSSFENTKLTNVKGLSNDLLLYAKEKGAIE